MANINVSFDGKNMSVSVDGNAVEGAESVCFYTYHDYDNPTEMKTQVTIYSKKVDEDGQKVHTSVTYASDKNGPVVVDSAKLNQSVANFLSRKE